MLDAWLENIEMPPHEEYFVIAGTAFGDLDIWGSIHGNCLSISSTTSQISPDLEVQKKEDWDILLATLIATRTKDRLDINDYKNKLLFDRAVKKYGGLTKYEMFGFEPALVLGGEAKLKNVRKLPVISYLQFLVSLDMPRMMLNIGKYVDEQGLE